MFYVVDLTFPRKLITNIKNGEIFNKSIPNKNEKRTLEKEKIFFTFLILLSIMGVQETAFGTGNFYEAINGCVGRELEVNEPAFFTMTEIYKQKYDIYYSLILLKNSIKK